MGDIIQAKGVYSILKKMNVPDKDIVYLDRDCLADYNGNEYIILLVSGAFGYFPGTRLRMLPFPEKIIPIFLGISCIDEKNMAYFENNRYLRDEIIGCRDMQTLDLFRRYGFKAFFTGCVSLCIEEKCCANEYSMNDVVISNGVPQGVLKYMPNSIREKRIIVDQQVNMEEQYITANPLDAQEIFDEKARSLFELYKKSSLVITSKMHCALPCLAMKKPVIFVKDSLDYRFRGYEKLLNPYTRDMFDKIDWNPEVKDVSIIRNMQMKFYIDQIKRVLNKYLDVCTLSEHFENCQPAQEIYFSGWKAGYLSLQEKKDIFLGNKKVDILNYITHKNPRETTLIIWGAGDKGICMLNRYMNVISNYKQTFFVDNNFKNIKSIGFPYFRYEVVSPDIIRNYSRQERLIIVAADSHICGAGKDIAKSLIQDFSLVEGEDFFMLDKINNSVNIPIDDIGMPLNVWNGF